MKARTRRPLGLALGLAVAALALLWTRELRRLVHTAAEPPREVVVPPGTGVNGIAALLHSRGLGHPLVFRLRVLQRGDGARLRAGEYAFTGDLRLDDVIDRIVRGEVVRRDLTFPEGRNLAEMADLAAEKGLSRGAFLAAARDPTPILDLDPAAPDLEGYLFPDTYDLPRGEDASRVLVERMVRRFRDVLEAERFRLAGSRLSVREVVTLASIVELETARGDERPHIAAVFLNRLQKGMPLQTDPTVIYALRRAGTWDGNIRRADLDIDSPYNTYRRGGLPPGPIAAPGREAIRAVLEPLPSRDLYFVSRNDGTHEFTATLVDHQRAVNYYQRHRGPRPRATGPHPSGPRGPGALEPGGP